MIITKRVLHVDDNQAIRMLFEAVLKGHDFGFELILHQAIDGEDAIAKLGEINPDLVITDLDMPGVDGRGVIEYVRTNKPGTPVVVMSTCIPTKFNFKFDGFLEKPINANCLPYHISNMLGMLGYQTLNCRGEKCLRNKNYEYGRHSYP